MSSGDVIAAYAAIVATILAIIQIRQHLHSGPKFHLKLTPNVTLRDNGAIVSDNMFAITVTNVGSAPTTLERFFIEHSHGFSDEVLVPNSPEAPSYGKLPLLLRPGEQWVGLAIKTSDTFDGSYHAVVKDGYKLVAKIQLRYDPDDSVMEV